MEYSVTAIELTSTPAQASVIVFANEPSFSRRSSRLCQLRKQLPLVNFLKPDSHKRSRIRLVIEDEPFDGIWDTPVQENGCCDFVNSNGRRCAMGLALQGKLFWNPLRRNPCPFSCTGMEMTTKPLGAYAENP